MSEDLPVPLKRGEANARNCGYIWQALVCISACLAWAFVSSLAILANRHILVELSFPYPVTVAIMGMATTSVVSVTYCLLFLPEKHTKPVTLPFYAARVVPIGFFMAITFTTGNFAYLHLTVAFVQMLKAFCPVVTMLLLLVSGLEKGTPKLICAVVLLSSGVALASYGELHMSPLGLIAMMSSVVAEAVRLVMTQYLVVGCKFHIMQGLSLMSPACTFWLIIQAEIFEWRQLHWQTAAAIVKNNFMVFGAASLAGLAVNLLALVVIKRASSLTLKVLGIAKDAFLVSVSVLFLHEHVAQLQLVGYSISIVGLSLYTWVKAQ